MEIDLLEARKEVELLLETRKLFTEERKAEA